MSLRNALRRLTPSAWAVVGSGLALGILLLYAALARAAEPESVASPSWLDTATTPVVNFLGRHPLAFLVIGLAILVTNGLRVAWPIRAERPRLVAFMLGVLDPISGNFWALARWLAARIGFPVQTPKDDPPTGSGTLPDPNALPKGGGS